MDQNSKLNIVAEDGSNEVEDVSMLFNPVKDLKCQHLR